MLCVQIDILLLFLLLSLGIDNNLKKIGEALSLAKNLGFRERAFYFVKATIIKLVRNCLYKACPSERCEKKVNDINNGVYRCERCNKEYNSFIWRYMLKVSKSKVISLKLFTNLLDFFCILHFTLGRNSRWNRQCLGHPVSRSSWIIVGISVGHPWDNQRAKWRWIPCHS